MGELLVGLDRVDRTMGASVGGKGANLGALGRVDGVVVPPGFCITTAAFRGVVTPAIASALDALDAASDDPPGLATACADLRRRIETVEVPDALAHAVTATATALATALAGDDAADRVTFAVRSSATSEDLPTASFAGQHASFLHVALTEVVEHVRRCWASLFADHAVAYRARQGIDHRGVAMAVVVQRMVDADVSGVLFTADPVSGNRTVSALEATFGLGEALVAGLVDPDVVTVRDGEVATRTIGAKQVEVVPAPGGGTTRRPVEAARQARAALRDDQAVALAAIGRRVEQAFGAPQDIEWCLAGDRLHVVQSRPITTLFPVPDAPDDRPRVYVSVGHQQMMTDPMKPLGWSLFQLTSGAPMVEAGSRLFVDVTDALASPARRVGLLDVFDRSDPLLGDAVRTVVDRGFVPSVPDDGPPVPPPGMDPSTIDTDPATVDEAVARIDASIADLGRRIEGVTGPALVDLVLDDLGEMARVTFHPQSRQLIMAAMEAAWWLDDHLEEWLGERGAADALAQAVPHNPTSEMGLALLDVADAVRPHRAVVDHLRHVADGGGDRRRFLDDLDALAGGPAARAAIETWLERYGARGVGEIDVTRPRWHEDPAALVPLILGNVDHAEPGAATLRFEAGRAAARDAAADVLARLRALPDGDAKASEAAQQIARLRTYAGYREVPKFGIIRRYAIYKRALLAEADRLVADGVLAHRDDVCFLTLPELRDVLATATVDRDLVERRRAEHRAHHALVPPRVLTSEGERIDGAHHRDDVPRGALAGLAVSAGVVEGRARVVLDVAAARLEPGDILVTPFTDPSFAPLFVSVAGLVTEVGGRMTHGSVIAREYGLPAVVGVAHATRHIADGQRIRVHGTHGYVELLG